MNGLPRRFAVIGNIHRESEIERLTTLELEFTNVHWELFSKREKTPLASEKAKDALHSSILFCYRSVRTDVGIMGAPHSFPEVDNPTYTPYPVGFLFPDPLTLLQRSSHPNRVRSLSHTESRSMLHLSPGLGLAKPEANISLQTRRTLRNNSHCRFRGSRLEHQPRQHRRSQRY